MYPLSKAQQIGMGFHDERLRCSIVHPYRNPPICRIELLRMLLLQLISRQRTA